jgi:dephospho-CoA kinase
MRIKLKTALLDQTLISGLGNIYVDEVCFLANLHPELPCNYLTLYDCKVILEKARYILEGAIKAGGTTIRSYTSSLGVTGRFQLKLHVHTKVGMPCENCKELIKKITVGGRGTYLCDNCQKLDKPLIIGITGGIGTGKSSVTSYLRKELLYKVIDTDIISKEVASDESFLKTIKLVFGDEYIVDGALDRKKMAHLIFNNKEANHLLTSLMHPIIKQKVIEEIKESKQKLIFIDVPLLYESGFDDLCHYVICVYTNVDINIERLLKRDNISKEDAIIRINSQMEIELKKQKAHFIIDNSFDLCYTYKQVDEVVHKILEMRK